MRRALKVFGLFCCLPVIFCAAPANKPNLSLFTLEIGADKDSVVRVFIHSIPELDKKLYRTLKESYESILELNQRISSIPPPPGSNTIERPEIEMPDKPEAPVQARGNTVYSKNLEVGGLLFSGVLAKFDDRKKLVSIEARFDPRNFEEVAAALIEKHGKPETVKELVQNRMGATFEQVTMSWRSPAASLMVSKYFVDLTEGHIMLLSPTEESKITSEQKKRHEAIKKGL